MQQTKQHNGVQSTIAQLCAIVLLSFSFILGACAPAERTSIDVLNDSAYINHYRNLDAAQRYARRALALAQSASLSDAQAEALNHLAFVSIARMDYRRAHQQLDSALAITDNQVELLVAEVQQMRLCQRRSENRAFYEHRERAQSHLNRINEERGMLSPHQQRRLRYAQSEMAIVNSTYYYYVGLERQSQEALAELDLDEVRRDTAQYLNYLYNIGAGGILTEGTSEQIHADEIDYLTRCLTIARRYHYPYFEAQAKEALADHTAVAAAVPGRSALALAEEALALFKQYGDIYQIAGAYRTLASCYHAMGDDRQALDNLHLALADRRISQAPDLVASIREQLSVAYSALDDKPNSDKNRNIYIDLQEQTRQDRELEARAAMYEQSSTQLNWMIGAVVLAILLLLFLLWLFNRLNLRQQQDRQLDDQLEEKAELLTERQRSVELAERQYLEQRAKVSLVNSITPLINRMQHEATHLAASGSRRDEQLEYINELTDQIVQQNDVLTHWIQLRQGRLTLRIESFPLQPLFDMVARSQMSFKMKGVTLTVHPTEATVKADRILTLFMLNTLADNARKFTDRGGEVSISAEECADYVELSVEDTGRGMSEEQLAHVFDTKPIRDDSVQRSMSNVQRPHGFGLLNCKGIIEKYRKVSQIFSVSLLQAESRKGQGSRFYFRLPKGVKRTIAILVILTGQQAVFAADDYLSRAHIYADSAYFSNINGTYARTLLFADSCRDCLNAFYRQQRPQGRHLMRAMGNASQTAPEILWLHDSLKTNYQIILDIRNESAVAALALHEWQLYAYNNKVYTQLFKELSADNTLADYCRGMQQSQANKRIAIILLLLTLLLIVPAYYMLYYRHRLYNRFRRESMLLTNLELADDELRRAEQERNNLHVANAVLDNCLSTLKHETMYYPSRIRQLADGDVDSLAEVVSYYRELYVMLSEQATLQVERARLHLKPVELYGQTVLGDANLLHYLFELLSGETEAAPRDEHYVLFRIRQQLSPAHLSTLFVPSVDTIPYLLCRQIVRDHGEATNRHGCGIWAEEEDGQTYIKLTLPKYGKL